MNSEQSQREDFQLATLIKDERCRASFTRLFEKYKQQVHYICYERLSNHEDAEDASQEAFSSFWQHIDQWNGGRVKPYLLGITRHTAIKLRVYNARKKRSGEMVYLDAKDGELADPRAEYCVVVENEVELEFDKVLLEMKPKWRLAWILHYRENYTFREVAEIMGGVSRNAAHLWVTAANKVIRKMLWVFYDDLMGDGDY